MESLTFHCPACATQLKVPADKAGHKARCKRCGEVVTIPSCGPPEPKSEGLPTRDGGATGAEQSQPHPNTPFEVVEESEPTTAPRRRNTRGRKSPERLAALRSAPGWRKVRLGLILIALFMCWSALWGFVGVIISLDWAPLVYLHRALPLAGHVLCAFVPLKGVARKLVMANLAVLAFGLALTTVAGWMSKQPLADQDQALLELAERTRTRSDERVKQLKEEQDLNRKLAELRKKAKAGDQEAGTEEQKVAGKLAELRKKHAAEEAETLKSTMAGIEAGATRSLSGVDRLLTWIHVSGQWHLLLNSIQIIILSFFIRAIALELGEIGLAANCPRVAMLAALVLILVLLGQVVAPNVQFAARVFFWITYVLGLVLYMWQGLMLIDAAAAIGRHLEGEPR